MKRLPFILIVAFLTGCSWGTHHLSGTVTDADTGKPIPNASVKVGWYFWGRSDAGYIVWDKWRGVLTNTDASGRYEASYWGAANATVYVYSPPVEKGQRPYDLDQKYSAGAATLNFALRRQQPPTK